MYQFKYVAKFDYICHKLDKLLKYMVLELNKIDFRVFRKITEMKLLIRFVLN